MVRVHPAEVLARKERLDTGIEFVEHNGEVRWVPTGRVEPEPRSAQIPDTDEGEGLEPHEWHLLRKFIDGGISGREHRDPVLAVDAVVPLGIGPYSSHIQRPTTDDDRRIIVQVVAFSDVSSPAHVGLTAAQPCRAWP